jgi:transposase
VRKTVIDRQDGAVADPAPAHPKRPPQPDQASRQARHQRNNKRKPANGSRKGSTDSASGTDSKTSKKKTKKKKTRRKSGIDLNLLEQIQPDAAGIDIGDTHFHVAVPPDRDAQPVREFETFTCDCRQIARWLHACGVKTVAMESTGVYWIALFEVLEREGFQTYLIDPRQTKQVPGRKTDILDCQWIQVLHSYGLLRPSFRPDDTICVLRSYLRQRVMLIDHAGQHVQHMQKAMQQMNVKLSVVLDDITGATGMRIIDAILGGERDPRKLATLRDERCKNDEATIAKALEGNWRDDHLFALKQAVDLYRYYHVLMVELDERLAAYLETFEDKSEGKTAPPKPSRKRRRNELSFDVHQLLFRMTGMDLTVIDGLDAYSLLKIISETGTDMSRWPTEKHFTSWLTLCPGSKQSGSYRKGKTRRSTNRAATVFRLAAQSVGRTQTALGAFYRRMKARLGAPKAITATAHKLAKIFYNMLRYGRKYVDRGVQYYEEQYRQRVIANLKRRAKEVGFCVISTEALQERFLCYLKGELNEEDSHALHDFIAALNT